MKNGSLLPVIFLLTLCHFGAVVLSSSCFQVHANATSDGGVIWVPSNYTTITDALAHSTDGDTIIVESGVYNESLIEVNKTVRIVGANRESTVVDGVGTDDFIFKVNANDTVIENLTLQNTILASEVASAVRLLDVTNVTIKNTIIRSVSVGVEIIRSNLSEIMYNRIFESNRGVRIRDSSCNSTIVGNTFENLTAILVSDVASEYTKIWHNNFVNSTVPPFPATIYFDDGYPSGGNYWSNHTAPDLYHGPDQNILGSDGILDREYPSPDSPWDRYPLAHQLTKIDVVTQWKDFEVKVSTNSTLTSYDFNVSAKMLTLFLSGAGMSDGSCRVSIPKELLSGDWTVSCDGGDVSYLNWCDDENFTYLYFTYLQSVSSKVEIRGTMAIPEVSLLLLVVAFLALFFMLYCLRRFSGGGMR